MPFSAELIVPVGGKCLTFLSQSRYIRFAIERASEWKGELRIQVLPQLLLTNVYGRPCSQEDHEVALWNSSSSVDLLVEQDITNAKYQALIGEWNLPFLRG